MIHVTDAQHVYCNDVINKLKMYDIRAEDCLQKLIRDGETKKIPFMVVVGSKEVESEAVTVRSWFA